MVQALQFTSDFKLGHYMKIPPRPMFWCQVVATIIAGTVQLAVQDWMFGNIGAYICNRRIGSITNSGILWLRWHVSNSPKGWVSAYLSFLIMN